ncbi:STAS domain-containing protein [Rubinisphaera italica]|uniref:STAS domain protein n=1 Tax=Rubinisphaera italica TaxID=2527969 RepID=A0A5C5XI95_9PLAN|nr:STAS domain-containing protein [Rubinisphaera italica]TWT62524.1 STAS domain protein [Rubinisphaera italica]
MSRQAHYSITRDNQTLIFSMCEWARFETSDYRKTIQEDLQRQDFEGCQNAIVDCTGLKYANSLFLESLLYIAAEMKRRGGKFCVCGVEPFVGELIQITHLDQRWPIYLNCDEAKAALS